MKISSNTVRDPHDIYRPPWPHKAEQGVSVLSLSPRGIGVAARVPRHVTPCGRLQITHSSRPLCCPFITSHHATLRCHAPPIAKMLDQPIHLRVPCQNLVVFFDKNLLLHTSVSVVPAQDDNILRTALSPTTLVGLYIIHVGLRFFFFFTLSS
jgi:hypothetical protein